MSDIAIAVENVGKRYRIGLKDSRPDTIMGALTGWMRSPLRNYRQLRDLSHFDESESEDVLWALRDVSFQVPQGEVLGIVGRNGAGKSTLLKIVSRITEPTEGRVVLRGRVASLLEVGTGMHPELTGRENVYLNGTVLGMSKREVERKFDEIVDFAGIGRFVDTPTKRYSSGMKVRLAFAVAAHLEPEILLIDEVLAVGDAQFQQKCLGKMHDVTREGRTVLFVSHDMSAVQRLCNRAILIDNGSITDIGDPHDVIRNYLEGSADIDAREVTGRFKDSRLRLRGIRVRQGDLIDPAYLDPTAEVRVEFEYMVSERVSRLLLGVDFFAADGLQLFRTYDLAAFGMGERAPGRYVSTLVLPPGVFAAGTYYLDFLAGIHRQGWISRQDIRVKLSFGSHRETDVTYPGVLKSIGRWEVTEHDLAEEAARV